MTLRINIRDLQFHGSARNGWRVPKSGVVECRCNVPPGCTIWQCAALWYMWLNLTWHCLTKLKHISTAHFKRNRESKLSVCSMCVVHSCIKRQFSVSWMTRRHRHQRLWIDPVRPFSPAMFYTSLMTNRGQIARPPRTGTPETTTTSPNGTLALTCLWGVLSGGGVPELNVVARSLISA